MKHRILIILLILLSNSLVFAQEAENQSYQFSIKEAIDFALENNRAAKNA